MWVQGLGELPGRLIVVSGPSGSGKSTLLRRALDRPGVKAVMSVSATTRRPRPGEEEGIHYVFLSRAEFEARIGLGEFLEHAEFNRQLYGTPAGPVFGAVAEGSTVILEIEVDGARQVREKAPTALFVFVDVPRFSTLEARLRARGTEDDASIHRRLVRARLERENAHWYDERIFNVDLDEATEQLAEILRRDPSDGE